VSRHDDTLGTAVDGVLDELRTDGTLAALGRRWLGTAATSSATQVLT
jgi:ABC-type amino acid transport substrate-binding protein